jgi:hypothetical protein
LPDDARPDLPPEQAKLTCNQVSMLLSQGQDRPLGAVERLRLEAHLKLCRGCDNFRRQLEFLRRALRRHPALREDEER